MLTFGRVDLEAGIVDVIAAFDEEADEVKETKTIAGHRPVPIYTEAGITRFQNSIRSIFLSGDNALTKNYLRFLVDRIVVNGSHVQMVTRSEAVVRLMAAGGRVTPGTAVERDPGVSPTFDVGWLRLLDSNQRPGG